MITARDVRFIRAAGGGGPPPPEDSHLAKVIKYIPAEIVAAYQTGEGLILSGDLGPGIHWVWVSFLFLLTPLWTAYATRTPEQPVAWLQATVAPFAFLVWIFALGGPFLQQALNWYKPALGSLVLIAVTLLIPLTEKIFMR